MQDINYHSEEAIFGSNPLPSHSESVLFHQKNLQKNRQRVSPCSLWLDLSRSMNDQMMIQTSDKGVVNLTGEQLLWDALMHFDKYLKEEAEIAKMVQLQILGCGVKPGRWEHWGLQLPKNHPGIVKQIQPFLPASRTKFQRRQPFGGTQVGAMARLGMKTWEEFYSALDSLGREYNPLEVLLFTDGIPTDKYVEPLNFLSAIRDDWTRTMLQLQAIMKDPIKKHRMMLTIVLTNKEAFEEMNLIAPGRVIPAFNCDLRGIFKEYSMKLRDQSQKLQTGQQGQVPLNMQNLQAVVQTLPTTPSNETLSIPYINPDVQENLNFQEGTNTPNWGEGFVISDDK